ncbi:hypothetical protein ACRAJ3_25185 [Rhodococcus pyridinivorans]|uniref:hypothetical protein n=1 Tax=Rhodococcus pyridinivorans TaxID=103816 RepID=UPI003D7F86BF
MTSIPLPQDERYAHMVRVDTSPWSVLQKLPFLMGPIRTNMAFLEDYLNAQLKGDAHVTILVAIPSEKPIEEKP